MLKLPTDVKLLVLQLCRRRQHLPTNFQFNPRVVSNYFASQTCLPPKNLRYFFSVSLARAGFWLSLDGLLLSLAVLLSLFYVIREFDRMSQTTRNNREIIAETRTYIFRWRTRCCRNASPFCFRILGPSDDGKILLIIFLTF